MILDNILDILLDATLDSLGVFLFAFIIHFTLSFFEGKTYKIFKKHKQSAPIFAALLGFIPQCGVSVVASDLYIKRRITMGVVVATFFSCSDEALPILLSDFSKAYYIIPLLLIKFIIGFSLGYLVDLFIHRKESMFKEFDKDDQDNPIGCCNHHIEEEKEESKIKKHLVHPLLHSLKILLYVFIVNLIFNTLFFFVDKEVISSFIEAHNYLSPIFASLIGLIPNCASSLLISELFLENILPFGALVSGLCVNSGLGIIYLMKNKEVRKDAFIILAILFVSSLLTGYLTIAITALLQ